MVYQLQRPSIEMIIDYCRDLLADEKLEVYEFGQNCDLVLHIYKDGEYMEYAINIKETLSRTIIVEADDLCEALQNVEDAANEGRINLTCDDSFDRDITPAEWTHEGVIPDGSNTDYYEHLYKSTSIEYLYADGSNYKTFNKIIVPGRYTAEQIDTIIKCLNEEQWFIPSKIGFPEEKIDDVEIEDDYPWFELNVWDFKDSTKPPQIDKSPEEVVDLFLAAKGHWEE